MQRRLKISHALTAGALIGLGAISMAPLASAASAAPAPPAAPAASARSPRRVDAVPYDAVPRLAKRSHVVLLGTGTPNPVQGRQGPALAVVVERQPYLFDAGAGVVRRAMTAARVGSREMHPRRLDTLFLTHLHSDHTVGLADVMLSPWVLGRERPLKVFGPPGTARMAALVHEAYAEDIRVRTEGLEAAPPEGHRVEAVDAAPGKVYRDANVEVLAFRAQHGAWRDAYGYRVVTPEIDICLSGDTTGYAEMVASYRGCDILVHEVYSERSLRTQPEPRQQYHRASHTAAAELGAVAAQVRPTLLVLTHQLTWGQPRASILGELRTAYGGAVVYGEDLMVIGLSRDFQSGLRGRRPQGRILVATPGRPR